MTTYTTTATATSATGNLITVASTTNMFLGLPITFSGTVFGGITADYTYYILSIDYTNSKISISPLPAGVATTLTTATGTMSVSFTSGGQQIIDVVPPGTSLNTAFEYINTNFDQVFAAGPVGTNVQIVGNKIQTLNTNGDLTLAPNGTGKVIANVDILPNINYVRSLGNINRRWNSVYAQTLDVSSEVDFSGDVTIGGNLTVTGDIIEMGNIVTDTKTIQLANTASTANAANGSGITVGANDNIATMLYNSTSNTWVMNIGANITGNVTAPYFIGNGSQLTGITSYANANAVAYGQAGWAGNIIPGADNTYSLGNATNQWSDLYVSNATIYMNNIPISLTAGNVLTVDGQPILSNDSNVSISTTGNISAEAGLFNDINLNNAGTNKLLYTDEDRNIYDTSFSYWSGNNAISGSGNITAGYFIGDGSQLSNVASTGNIAFQDTTMYIAPGVAATEINISPNGESWAFLQLPNDATANTANTRLWNSAGNVEIGTGDFSTGGTSYTWYFDNTGNLSVPSSVNFNGGSIVQTPDEDLHIIVQDAENDGWSLMLDVTDGTSTQSRIQQRTDQIEFGLGLTTGPTRYWQFNDSGVTNLPGDVWSDYSGNLSIIARGVTDSSFVELATQDNSDIKRSNVRVARDNVTVTTGSGASNWTFGVDGNLTVPGNIQTIDTDSWPFNSTITGITTGSATVVVSLTDNVFPDPVTGQVVISGVVGTTEANATWYYLAVDSNQFQLFHDVARSIPVDGTAWTAYVSGGTAIAVTFKNLSITGGNIQITANGSTTNSWLFSTNGNLTLPNAGNIVGATANNDGSLQWIGNSSGDGYGYTTLQLRPDNTLIGNDQYLIVDPTSPNHIHIRAGGTQDNSNSYLFLGGETSHFQVPAGLNPSVLVSANSAVWTFGNDGILTLPGEGVLKSVDDTVTLLSLNTSTGNANSVYLGTSGGLGFMDQAILSNWLEIFRSGGDPEIAAPLGNLLLVAATGTSGAGGKNVVITGGSADQMNYSNTAGGNVNIVGGLGATDDGGGGGPGGSVNITSGLSADPAGHAGNINITAGSNSWVFDYNGNITLPGNIQGAASYNQPNLIQPNSGDGAWAYGIFGNVSDVWLQASMYGNGDEHHGFRILDTDGNTVAFSVDGLGHATVSGNVTAGNFLGSGSNVDIIAGSYDWKFDNAGNLTLPGNTFSVNYANGTAVTLGGSYGNANVADFLDSLGSNAIVTTGNIDAGNLNATTGVANVANLYMNTGYVNTAASAGINIVPGSTATGTRVWSKLVPNANVLFSLGSSTEYWANGYIGNIISTTVSATGNVTGGNITTTGLLAVTGNANIVGTASTGIGAVTAGATNTLLSNTVAGFTGNVNNYTQVTFQNKNTGTDATADYILTADNGSDSVNYGDFGIINSGYDNGTPTNSLGNIVYAADTYIYAQGNVSNTSQSGGNLVIGTTTAAKTVKIFAGGNTNSALVANISNTGVAVTGAITATGNVTAANFSGNISITGNVTGTSANVTLVAGSYSYVFDNAGEVTLPAVGGDEGGQINLTVPATNTTLQNKVAVDIYQNKIRFYEGSANAQGLYMDLSQAPTGVGGQIGYKASGYVNAGSFVTLDNIKATLTSSGNRGLSLATTTGSITATIAATYAVSGGAGASSSNGTVTYNTTPSSSVFGWNFAGAGDSSTYLLNDTTNSRCYRITLVIGGGFTNNFISIERL